VAAWAPASGPRPPADWSANEQALDKESAYLLAGKPLPANGKADDKTN